MGARRVIGTVAVDQQIYVRINVREHAADDVALALQRLLAHDGAGGAGMGGGLIRRVVVIDIDGRRRELGLEGFDHARDREGLVVAGDKNGDAGHGRRKRLRRRAQLLKSSGRGMPSQHFRPQRIHRSPTLKPGLARVDGVRV